MTTSPTPNPSILDLVAYQPGKSTLGADKPVIKLSSNENALGSSPKALEAYRQAAAHLHRYPDGQAILFKEALQEIEGLSPEQVVCGAGSDEIIHLLIQAYAAPGDEVLYSEHGFLMYAIYARACGAVPTTAPETNLTTHVDALLAAVTKRTKLVFVANPNNPTGTCLPADEIKRLRHNLPAHIVLVLDGAYAELVTMENYSDGRQLVDASDNTVMLRTLSKAYGLPALRLGYGYMPAGMADIINRIRGPFNVSSPAIAAGAAAIRDREFLAKSIAHNTQWRRRLTDELTELGLKIFPSEGNFVLAECTGGKSAAQINQALLAEGIIVRDVRNYGLTNHLRITIGTESENHIVIKALSDCLR